MFFLGGVLKQIQVSVHHTHLSTVGRMESRQLDVHVVYNHRLKL